MYPSGIPLGVHRHFSACSSAVVAAAEQPTCKTSDISTPEGTAVTGCDLPSFVHARLSSLLASFLFWSGTRFCIRTRYGKSLFFLCCAFYGIPNVETATYHALRAAEI
jgi:hypothetical protein